MAGLESQRKFKFDLRDRKKIKKDEVGSPLPTQLRKKALLEFDQEISLPINSEFEDLFNRATQHYEAGDDKQALSFYFKALSVSKFDGPKLFASYKNIGNILLRNGDLESAEEYYNKAFTLNPDSDTLMVNLGTLEIQRGDFERALGRYRSAVEINSSNEKAWIGLSLIHRQYGDLDLAWANLEKALDINTQSLTALDLAVQWGVKDSRFDSLIQHIQNYLELQENSDIRLTLAKVYVCCNRLRQALGELEHVLTINPKLNEASELLAVVSESIKQD